MKKLFNYCSLEVKGPKKEHRFDACYDLFLPQNITLKPFETYSIDLRVKVNLAENQCGIVIMRSRYALTGLISHNSPVDYGYSGNIHLIVTNCSTKTFNFKLGESICQLLIINIPIENDKEYFNEELRK